MRGRQAGKSALICLAALLAACSSSAPAQTTALHDGAITVASFNFPESVLLAEIYSQVLEGAGYRVVRQLDLGPRELVEPALERGLVELVPEYAGSALDFLAGEGSASADADATHRALARAFAERGIAALQAAPAQDQNGFVVTRDTAARYGLRSISDLARVTSRLSLGGPPECPQRALCLQGLESTYGLTFKAFVPLDEAGPLTIAALQSGQVQVGLMFTSDGAIDANHLVLLADDRHLQPAENVTPVVRSEVLDRFGPGVLDAVNAVSAKLTTADLQRMNAEVSVGGRAPSAVAAEWLRANGSAGPVD